MSWHEPGFVPGVIGRVVAAGLNEQGGSWAGHVDSREAEAKGGSSDCPAHVCTDPVSCSRVSGAAMSHYFFLGIPESHVLPLAELHG